MCYRYFWVAEHVYPSMRLGERPVLLGEGNVGGYRLLVSMELNNSIYF